MPSPSSRLLATILVNVLVGQESYDAQVLLLSLNRLTGHTGHLFIYLLEYTCFEKRHS